MLDYIQDIVYLNIPRFSVNMSDTWNPTVNSLNYEILQPAVKDKIS